MSAANRESASDSTIGSRPTFAWSDVAAVAERFGAFEFVKMLPSERDQNFLLRPPGGAEDGMVVLKVHNPTDEAAFVDCQAQGLELAARGGASCQRQLCTSDTGDCMVALALPCGALCQVRALTFLPGEMLADAAAAAAGAAELADLFNAVGSAVGGLSAAMLGFEHAAAHRHFHWDLQTCEDVIGKYVGDVREDRRSLIGEFLARYRSLVKPHLPEIRKSIVHNDLNDYNLVVMKDGAVGVLDFGDMVYSYTCADAAICLAYLLFHCSAEAPLLEAALPFVRGFHARCSLSAAECRVLFGLAVMRVCTSVCMSAYQSRLEPDNEYLLISAGPAWALLERLASGSEEEAAPGVVSRACGFA